MAKRFRANTLILFKVKLWIGDCSTVEQYGTLQEWTGISEEQLASMDDERVKERLVDALDSWKDRVTSCDMKVLDQ